MGLETLKSRRDKAKLKWWYKLASMPVRRYPRQLFNQEWKVKPHRGRQWKPWNRYVDLVKEYIIDLWEVRKIKLYGEPCSTQPQSQSSAGDPRDGWGAEKR